MLIFKDQAIYEQVVFDSTTNAREKFRASILAMKHTTYSEYAKVNNISIASSLIDDDYFADIVNKDRIVQIGNFIFKINIQSKSVYVLPAKDVANYNDLITENIKNKAIRVFSTEDDVLTWI